MLLGGFGGHLGAFGRPWDVFWVASAGQRIHDNFFRHLGGSWCDFWCLRGAVGGLLGAFWGHLGAFGWHVAVVFWFCVGKHETVKSVVLLNEIYVLRGGGGVGWSFFQSFWMFLVIWRVLGSFLGIICYGIGIGGFEAGLLQDFGCRCSSSH